MKRSSCLVIKRICYACSVICVCISEAEYQYKCNKYALAYAQFDQKLFEHFNFNSIIFMDIRDPWSIIENIIHIFLKGAKLVVWSVYMFQIFSFNNFRWIVKVILSKFFQPVHYSTLFQYKWRSTKILLSVKMNLILEILYHNFKYSLDILWFFRRLYRISFLIIQAIPL